VQVLPFTAEPVHGGVGSHEAANRTVHGSPWPISWEEKEEKKQVIGLLPQGAQD